MSFHSWLQSLRSALTSGRGQRHHRRRGAPRATTLRPNVEVLEDRLTPSFSPATSFSVGPNPQAVVTGDFNNDGKLDLATANYDNGTVSALIGDGHGGFGAAKQSAVGTLPLSLAVADFNNDGKLDLAVIQGTAGSYWSNSMSVVLGNGDGTFRAPTPLGSTWIPLAAAAGDFNADGNTDLVVGQDDWEGGGYVEVLLGNGRGGFTAAGGEYSYHALSAASPAVGDLNGDGKLDAVMVCGPGSSGGFVLLGNGDGTFGQYDLNWPQFDTGPDPRAVAVGDFTGDGIPDLVSAGQTVDVQPGLGDGWFDAPISQTANGNMHTSVGVADFNGDGKLDAVTSDADTGTVSELLGNGNGTLTYAGAYAFGSSPSGVAISDFTGDGRPDAATANAGSNTVSVLFNDGRAPLPPSLRIGDVTLKEGNTGLVAATFAVTLSAASPDTITVAYAAANGTATADSDYQATSGTLTIPAGQSSGSITILVNGDRLAEPNETFVVNLSNATNATIADGHGVGTILDDEPRISMSDVTKYEGKKNQTTLFTVDLRRGGSAIRPR
jgi:FG-GAP-like repeat/Calx-beta domain